MKKLSDLRKIRISKEQICCLAVAAALAGLSALVSTHGTVEDGYTLTRSDPGGASVEYELKLGGIGEDDTISVKVSSRVYTEEEANQKFEALMEELPLYIVGNNEDLDRIDSDLFFPTGISGYDGIKVSIYPADSNLIGFDGTVSNIDLEESEETYLNVTLRATLKDGVYTRDYAIPVTVYPREAVSPEEIKEKLISYINRADSEQRESAVLTLPDSFEGLSLSYEEKKDHLTAWILLGGILAAVLVGLRPRQEQRKRERERENELLRDYSEMVSKLIVYMGAGLSLRNAWTQIVRDYQSECADAGMPRRALYEEMLITASEIDNKVSETEAYREFARRTGQRCYMKLVSILEQNIRNGDQRSQAALDLEMQEAFEQRKNIARRRGEEAGTKLILPLMISLMTVLIITAAPALMSFT